MICFVLYVLVFLWKSATPDSLQSIGMATAKSLYGPWTENPNNPIIKPVAGTSNAAHASNPSFLVDRDGKFRIYYKSMSEGSQFREISVSIADEIEGPYLDFPGNPLITSEPELDNSSVIVVNNSSLPNSGFNDGAEPII